MPRLRRSSLPALLPIATATLAALGVVLGLASGDMTRHRPSELATLPGLIALLLVPLIYLLRTIVDEARREDAPPWRWGDRQRYASPETTWGRHEFCVIGTAIAVLAALGVLT